MVENSPTPCADVPITPQVIAQPNNVIMMLAPSAIPTAMDNNTILMQMLVAHLDNKLDWLLAHIEALEKGPKAHNHWIMKNQDYNDYDRDTGHMGANYTSNYKITLAQHVTGSTSTGWEMSVPRPSLRSALETFDPCIYCKDIYHQSFICPTTFVANRDNAYRECTHCGGVYHPSTQCPVIIS